MLEKRCSLKGKLKWDMLPIIFVLAWPTMLEQLLQTAVQYIDTTMVGSLGTQATAAVGSTTTVNWLIGSSVSAVGVGFLAYISQAYGKGDKESAKKASAQSVLAVLILGAFFTALTLSLARFVPIWMQVDPLSADVAQMCEHNFRNDTARRWGYQNTYARGRIGEHNKRCVKLLLYLSNTRNLAPGAGFYDLRNGLGRYWRGYCECGFIPRRWNFNNRRFALP